MKKLLTLTILITLVSSCYNKTSNEGLTQDKNEISSKTVEDENALREKGRIIEIDGLSIFYREAGKGNKETILLLHGFPSSSFMFKDIMAELSSEYHVIAPDYPGFGLSSSPKTTVFEYTFDKVSIIMEQFVDTLELEPFYLFVQDYGGPIGFRLANKRPELIKGLIIQNANAYMEGLGEWAMKIGAFQQANDVDGLNKFKDYLLSFDGLKEQHLGGAKEPSSIDPSYYLMDNAFLNREGAKQIQTAMFFDYGSNFPKYPEWQDYFRTHQPKTLVVWGENDRFFSKAGGEAYSKDLENIESYYFNGSHFMLDEHYVEVAEKVKNFINEQ